MCEYGKQSSCKNCNDAIKDGYFVIGCSIEDEELQKDEELMNLIENMPN